MCIICKLGCTLKGIGGSQWLFFYLVRLDKEFCKQLVAVSLIVIRETV